MARSKEFPHAVNALTAYLLLCMQLLLCFDWTDGQIAKSSYYMDSKSDCYIAGYLLIPTGNVVNINSRNPLGGDQDILTCSLRFKPQTSGAVMDVRFATYTVSDCDVTLRVELTGAASYTLGCTDKMPNEMIADDGTALVSVTKRTIDDKDYSFGIIIRAYRKDNTLAQDESPVATGLIVGIVGGIVGFLLLLIVIGVCCYKKKKKYLRAQAEREYKADLTETISPAHSYGYDNGGTKEKVDTYDDDTPSSKKKLLMSKSGRGMDPRDQSESESETKDKEPEIIRQLNKSPSKTAALNFENERMRRGNQQSQPAVKREEPVMRSEVKPSGGQSSSILSALHNNPRFRASFHANEADAEERAQRISQSSMTNEPGTDSEASAAETWNTSFETQLSEDDRPKTRSIPKPPPLPPVPMSPRAPLRAQNTATIRRAPRPSSSASDIVHLQSDSDSGDTGIRKISQDSEPSSPSEIVPIRVKDPHSPTARRRADTQHNLRPDRTRKPPEEKPFRPPPAPQLGEVKESLSKQSKPEKSSRNQEPSRQKSAKPEKSSRMADARIGPDEEPIRQKSAKPEKSSRMADARIEPDQEPEGRFKKATTTARKKTNAKSPRMGRSRSTGSALDDMGSVGRPSISNYKVPEVTADDYEDSDMESNYNPLRRTGSKTSLYASRSSLYGRRRRKGSIGSMASLARDDIDYYPPEPDSFGERRLSRRDRGFKSLGDLESEMREQRNRSTQTLRECATQTGTGFANVTPGKKTVVKRAKPKSVRSSTTQTAKSHERKDSSSSTSGLTKHRERKNSASSTSGIGKPRERKNSTSSTSGKPKKTKSEAESKMEKRKGPSEHQDTQKNKPKPQPKPKVKPRKSTTPGTDSGNEMDREDGATDQSSVITSSTAAQPMGHSMYPPKAYAPPYPMGYPPHIAYGSAPGQPPLMMPYASQPGMNPAYSNVTFGAMPQTTTATIPNPALQLQSKESKWDQLCRMTGAESNAGADSFETGSVAGSVFSNPPPGGMYPPQSFNPLQPLPPPSYTTSASNYYAGSERSAPRSVRAPSEASHQTALPSRSSWDALKEMTDRRQNISFASQGSDSPPSESHV